MAATLILWGHALAALLFAAVVVGMRGRRSAILPTRPLAAALVLTALWALAVAGIDARDVATRLVGAGRDVAWLIVLMVIVRRAGAREGSLAALHVAAIGLALLVAAVSLAEAAIPPMLGVGAALRDARLVLHAMQLLTGLVIVHGMADRAGARSPVRLVGLAVAAIWGADLLLVAAAAAGWTVATPSLVALRGAVLAGAALLVAAAVATRGEAALAVSRATTARLLLILALTAYAGLTASLTAAAPLIVAGHERLVETAIVFGATAALLTLLSTPWLRGWGKVMVAKHLFAHRYDYRAEWQRFSDTLARTEDRTGDAAAPLGERVARAMAELTVSPAALLLGREGEAMPLAARWRWDGEPVCPDAAALARHLADTGRIVDLDGVRGGTAPAGEIAAVPASLLADAQAWAVVPLAHLGELVGAVVLARPPVDRALDWEDFDLLRVAGRQAAGVLADERARAALADAERFDEFNRRFAFILHDIKNLVSQLSLVARNAERHADNPAFRADMVATLRESSDRMQALLARLSPQAVSREPVRAVDAARLVAGLRRRSGAVRGGAGATGGPWLVADPAALDTVLDHLVQNAAEASAPGEPVLVEIAERGGEVAITVVDRGCGMDAAFVRERLFRPFVSTRPGGFGLGAFEARQMVEAMGGRLLVDSRAGEGTRMTVLLPRAHAPAPTLAAA